MLGGSIGVAIGTVVLTVFVILFVVFFNSVPVLELLALPSSRRYERTDQLTIKNTVDNCNQDTWITGHPWLS